MRLGGCPPCCPADPTSLGTQEELSVPQDEMPSLQWGAPQSRASLPPTREPFFIPCISPSLLAVLSYPVKSANERRHGPIFHLWALSEITVSKPRDGRKIRSSQPSSPQFWHPGSLSHGFAPASPPATVPFPSGAHAGLTAALSVPACSLTAAPEGVGSLECASRKPGSATWTHQPRTMSLCASVLLLPQLTQGKSRHASSMTPVLITGGNCLSPRLCLWSVGLGEGLGVGMQRPWSWQGTL